MNYSSYHAVYVENKTAIGIFKHLCEEMQGSKAATHRTYSSLIIRGSLVEQLAAVLLGCDGRRQVNGDHLQQGISGRQPPPHHGLSREQSETRADCSQPAQHPSRACSCLVVNLHSQSSTTTQPNLTFRRGLPSLSLSSLSSLMSSFSISLAASSFLKCMIASKTWNNSGSFECCQ